MFKLAFIFFFTTLQTFAQYSIPNSQSSPLNWYNVENEFVQVIYPQGQDDNAVYIANLIEYYAKYVGVSYDIKKPKKVSLIYRPEMANPNGFAALAPRRTEWFNASNFFPHINTVEWHENLAIHEYRHIIQYDAFNQKTVKAFDFLFGDNGQSLLHFLANQPWFMEGDAVHAETKYTPAGRGRSPRFMARLKALVQNNQIPSYDQLVNGTYNDQLVSWYVYGYVLVSYGYKKYGDDFWYLVMDRLSHLPYPNGLTSAIEYYANVDFEEFYYDAFKSLSVKWNKEQTSSQVTTKKEYNIKTNQYKNKDALYYLEYDMNNYYRLIRETGSKKEILTDLSYSEDITRLDYTEKYAVMSQFLPHWRYGFKSYSDLLLINLKDGNKKYITNNQRIYNPHFNNDGTIITAVNFNKDGNWIIQEYDLEGNKKRSISNKDYDFLEAVNFDNDIIIAIATNKNGGKTLLKISHSTGEVQEIIPRTFNNIYWLQSNFKDSILFEAQHKGTVEVFKINLKTNNLKKCTSSNIAAYTPTFTDENILYVEETKNGKRIKNISIEQCKSIPYEILTSPDNYYSKDDPSDNYNNFEIMNISEKERSQLKSKEKYKSQKYSGFDWRAFTPHSWSFFVGQGYGLSLYADNYLRDFGWNINIGKETAENTPYSSIQIDFKRYWPILSVTADKRKRAVSQLGNDQYDYEWDELSYGTKVTVPFTSRFNLYNINIILSSQIENVETDDYIRYGNQAIGQSELTRYTHSFNFSLYKDLKARSIISPWSLSLLGMYQKAKTNDETGLTGDYRWYGEFNITTPGLFKNNGVRLMLTGEQYGDGNKYRFQPSADEMMGYTFSRGYEYFATNRYIKSSIEYVFPLLYPDINLSYFIYFKRLYMKIFYDNTKVYVTESGPNFKLSSYGAELIFNTFALRSIPIDLGVRYVYKHEIQDDEYQVFLATGIPF